MLGAASGSAQPGLWNTFPPQTGDQGQGGLEETLSVGLSAGGLGPEIGSPYVAQVGLKLGAPQSLLSPETTDVFLSGPAR